MVIKDTQKGDWVELCFKFSIRSTYSNVLNSVTIVKCNRIWTCGSSIGIIIHYESEVHMKGTIAGMMTVDSKREVIQRREY